MLCAAETPPPVPAEQKREKHGKDEVTFSVFEFPGGYKFSIQCRLGRFIRCLYPHQVPQLYATPKEAMQCAADTLRLWTRSSRAARERLYVFDLIEVNQLEFQF